jgi:hypothetical protein
MHRNIVMKSQRDKAFSRPSITVTCHEAVPVQDAGDEVVVCNKHKVTNGSDHVGRGAVTLTAAASW